MAISPLVIMLLSKEANCDVTTPHGANILMIDIESKTGQHISINTIKRIVGVLESDTTPRVATRDILARYLGYDNWRQLSNTINPASSAFYKKPPYLDARKEPPGTYLNILWEPGHGVKIKNLGEGKYTVVDSIKSKLQPGDVITLSFIAKRFPLVVSEVMRGTENLGSYIAGLDGGIMSLRRSKK